MNVMLDSMSNVYVTDSYNCRLQLFVPGQFNGTTIAGITNACTNFPNQFYSPYFVALDRKLDLYVADGDNHRIQKFSRY